MQTASTQACRLPDAGHSDRHRWPAPRCNPSQFPTICLSTVRKRPEIANAHAMNSRPAAARTPTRSRHAQANFEQSALQIQLLQRLRTLEACKWLRVAQRWIRLRRNHTTKSGRNWFPSANTFAHQCAQGSGLDDMWGQQRRVCLRYDLPTTLKAAQSRAQKRRLRKIMLPNQRSRRITVPPRRVAQIWPKSGGFWSKPPAQALLRRASTRPGSSAILAQR